jgi:hypothetical protein
MAIEIDYLPIEHSDLPVRHVSLPRVLPGLWEIMN